jgi:hypothetical protein
MTLLQQENRVHRSAKKADAHQRKNDLVSGLSMTQLPSVWNHASFSKTKRQPSSDAMTMHRSER